MIFDLWSLLSFIYFYLYFRLTYRLFKGSTDVMTLWNLSVSNEFKPIFFDFRNVNLNVDLWSLLNHPRSVRFIWWKVQLEMKSASVTWNVHCNVFWVRAFDKRVKMRVSLPTRDWKIKNRVTLPATNRPSPSGYVHTAMFSDQRTAKTVRLQKKGSCSLQGFEEDRQLYRHD